MTDRHWFERAFGGLATEIGDAVSQARHEWLGSWLGRNFEPHPSRPHDPEQGRSPGERDIHGNERGIDLDR